MISLVLKGFCISPCMLTFSRSKLDPELESRDQPVVSSNHNRSTGPSSPLAALLELCIGEEINQMEHVGLLGEGPLNLYHWWYLLCMGCIGHMGKIFREQTARLFLQRVPTFSL